MLKDASIEYTKPTNNWSYKTPANGQNMADLYVQNVLIYKAKMQETAIKYQQKELGIIRQIIANDRRKMNFFSIHYPSTHEVRFDSMEPKLWFTQKHIAPCSQLQSNLVIIKAMCMFAIEHGYFERDSGCHICLNIQHAINTPSGYLHLSADTFYRIHPVRDVFFKNFRNLSNYSIDT